MNIRDQRSVDQIRAFPLRHMAGIGNPDELRSTNSLVKFFTYGHGEHPVVFPPDDHGWVCDGAEVWSEISFPGGKGVSHGHNGFDDAGASAILVGPFHNRRREKVMVVDDFLQHRFGDQSAEQPVAEGDQPGRGSRFQGLSEGPASELGYHMRR